MAAATSTTPRRVDGRCAPRPTGRWPRARSDERRGAAGCRTGGAPGRRRAAPPARGRPRGAAVARRTCPPIVVFVGVDRRSGSSRSARSTSRRFVFPKPSAIVAALQANWCDGLRRSCRRRSRRSRRRSAGCSSGRSPASLVAFVDGPLRDRPRTSCCRSAIAASAVPIIAFAPLINNWFGRAQPAVEDDDGRRARVLPGHGQRDPRPRPRSSRRRSS